MFDPFRQSRFTYALVFRHSVSNGGLFVGTIIALRTFCRMGSQDQQDTGVYREGDATIIRVAQEQAFVSKHTAETSRVRINLTKETRSETLRADLRYETVEVRRVPVDREIQSAPPIREEGGVTIIRSWKSALSP